jgi:hypothetical protein
MKALLLSGALLMALPQTSVTGKWFWQGQAGWQRIALDLRADGSRLRGVLRMGPGGSEPATPKDFWEYFFDPADFEILNGRINGNTVSFEQEVRSGTVPSRFLYTGLVEGERIAFTREVVPNTNPKGPVIRGTHRVQFTVQRVR